MVLGHYRYGFNAVHVEVLKADNDDDLKCKLRANMCTKKALNNDNVTPIHCACINPNVKYLKTLLSITQEYNIADKRGRKPIHYAAVCEGKLEIIYLIISLSLTWESLSRAAQLNLNCNLEK